MRPKQTTADDTDITDVVQAFVPNVCVGADPLGTADTYSTEITEGFRQDEQNFQNANCFILSILVILSGPPALYPRFLCSWFPDSKESVSIRGWPELCCSVRCTPRRSRLLRRSAAKGWIVRRWVLSGVDLQKRRPVGISREALWSVKLRGSHAPLRSAATWRRFFTEITADAERVCRPQISQISAGSDS